LYEGTNDLEAASTRAEAYAATESVLTDVFPESVFRVTVEAEVVVEHGAPATSVDQPATTIEVGEQGWIEFDGSLQQHERSTIELFATYLNTTLDRIEREERLQEERDILAFVNRTLRHDLVGDLSLVRARLNIIDRNDAIADDSDPEHLGVALSRIEEMNEYIDRMGTYLKSVLDDCHELTAMELEPLIKEHVASFRESHPQAELRCEQLPTVTVEADELLHRVIVNLLRNGLEHNESPTPRITVEGERDGDTVQVRVADNGSGIADSRREAVFEQGERGTESDGSGFGLYLVKDVVENYGGTVRISDNEPRGSVFELDLPIA
jgi:signal transduction histidine kinase